MTTQPKKESQVAPRTRLPTTRKSITHKFTIHSSDEPVVCSVCGKRMSEPIPKDVDVYVTVSLYPNGMPGELFVKIGSYGDTVKGFMNQWAIMVSIALQYGVPLEKICEKGEHSRFEPAGMTDTLLCDNEGNVIGKISALSVIDYICRWLRLTFVEKTPSVI